MKPDGFEVPPLRTPLVPRTQRIPRVRDEQQPHRDPQQSGEQDPDEPESRRPAPNRETTGHEIDLET